MQQADKRRVITMLVSIAVLAAVAYGAAALAIGRPIVIRDAFAYNASAQRLLETGVYEYNPDVTSDTRTTNGPSAFTMPGYTVFLAGIYGLVPDSGSTVDGILAAQVPIIVVQLLLAVLAAELIAFAGYWMGGLRAGWCAGLLAVLYVPFGMNATVSLTETLALTLGSVVLVATVELLRSKTPSRPIAMGALMGVSAGLSTLVRPTIALWLLIPLAVWLWSHRATWRRALQVAVVALAGYALVMSPWVIRNAIALDAFIPLTSSASTPLLDSVGGATFTPAEEELIRKAEAKGEDPYRVVALARLRDRWTLSPSSFVMWKLGTLWTGVSNFANLPVDIIADVQSSTPQAGSFADAGAFLPIRSDTFYTRLFGALTVYHRLILLLAAVGVFLGRRRPVVWVLASLPLYYAIVHTVILFMVRYFYPAMPALIVLAGCAVAGLWTLAERRRAAASQ